MVQQAKSKTEILEKTGATVGVYDVNFEVQTGEIFVIMGLSGSGKSTLIRLLNRLIDPTSGDIYIDGQDVAKMNEEELRDVRRHKLNMVFQNFGLFPHRTILENTEFGLEVRGVDKEERTRLAEQALDNAGLLSFKDQYPDQLSGGMQQRVGLARALANNPDILLMDEAFSALDPLIRREMQDQLIDLQGKLGKTILFITHDLNEAMRLGDRIAMMRDGRVEQVGTAEEILRDPASDYVSRFVADVDRTRVLTAGSIAEPPYAVLGSDRSPRAAHKLLRENQPPWLLVQNRDRTPFGYVWEDDVARAVKEGSNALPLSTIHEMPVVSHSTPVNELFAHAAQHAAPIVVVDDDGRISGVIPRVTLLAAISEQNQEAGASSAASASSADPAAEQTDEQAGKASETTEAEGADA